MKFDFNLINLIIALVRLGIEFFRLFRDNRRRR